MWVQTANASRHLILRALSVQTCTLTTMVLVQYAAVRTVEDMPIVARADCAGATREFLGKQYCIEKGGAGEEEGNKRVHTIE